VRRSTKRKGRKVTTWLVLSVFMLTLTPGMVLAAEEAVDSAAVDGAVVDMIAPDGAISGIAVPGGAGVMPVERVTEPVKDLPAAGVEAGNVAVSLEEATKTVKAAFAIPPEFTKFSSGYSRSTNRQVWQLSWETEKEPWGHLNAQVDCQTGEILNMDMWQSISGSKPRGQLPVVSRAEAVKKAEQLVKQLQPGRLAQLKLEEDPGELLQLLSWGASTHRINWVRQVQGVPFPQDGITVQIDTQTGLITGYTFNWTDVEFPDAGKAISLTQARQVWNETEMLQLQYFRMNSGDRTALGPVKLVYRLIHPSGGVLDALTGKPLEVNRNIYRDEALSNAGGLAKTEDAAQELTPQELAEVVAASKVISQEKAEEVVRQWVTIPTHLTLQGAYLNRDEQRAPGARTWSMSWHYVGTEELAEDAVRWVSATVAAENGTLLSFSTDKAWQRPDPTKVKVMSIKEAQALADAFLQRIQPNLFGQVKLVETPDSGVRPLEKTMILPPYQGFQYQRLVNNVVYPENGMSVSVDLVTGEIQSYQLRWNPLAFPSTQGVLETAAIVNHYLQRQPLTLQYVQEYIYNETGATPVIKLVYKPVPAPGQLAEAMTDAMTGAALDWRGEELSLQPRPYKFTDIDGHWAAAEIALLGQAGLFGEYGETFRPNEPVKLVQYLRALFMLERGAASGTRMTDDEVMKEARQRGWLKEDALKPGDTVSRLQLSRIVIRFLGLESAAKIEGIYQAPYRDMKNIPTAEQGYVALSYGLGILRGEQGNFGAAVIVPRSQAAVSIIRMLKVETQ
jgi:hypothetical protein